jgi:hypothetical protein
MFEPCCNVLPLVSGVLAGHRYLRYESADCRQRSAP